MENIYEGCSESEKEEIINELESNFTSVFQQLVEKTGEGETEVGKRWDKEDLQNRKDENCVQRNQESEKKSQTNSKIVQRNLELHLSSEAQQRIHDILNEVRQLSEKEKLLLYLKLPTKTGGVTEENQPIPLSNTRQEQTQAFQWIRSNLEECESTYTLPKHEVYDDYKSYCESLGANRTLSAPDFGKIIKCVFPKVKARRLGTRGNSKYCYSGLRKRIPMESPSLPNVNGNNGTEVNNNNNSQVNNCNDLTEDQTLSAACNLVCEWANKLLGRVFTTLLDLARFLVGGSYVSTKSMAAFVVMSANESKVRKMSEKLQFRSTSSASSISPDSKSNSSDGKRSPLSTPASCSSEHLVTKLQQSSNQGQAKPCFQASQCHVTANSGTERPQSLPGLQITIGSLDTKNGNHLMSPPQCLPPKALAKAPSIGSPGLNVSVAQMRGKLASSNTFLQTSEGTFPVIAQQQQPSPGFTTKPQISSPNQGTKRQGQRGSTALKRSDSCPYPSQSPRSLRQVGTAAVALSPRIPNEATRNQPWQKTIGHQPIHVTTTENALHSMRDLNKLMQEQQQQQVISPLRGTPLHGAMATPNNGQPLLQRCHSVPVPYSSPQGDIYQPLTPQLGTHAGISSAGGNRSPSYTHMKEMRTKFLSNEIQSSARRNLTPSFLSKERDGDIVGMNKNRTMAVQSQNVNIDDQVSSPQNRKQHLSLMDEPLASVDSLIDSPFSLGGVDTSSGCDNVTSGGSGLSDLDGLDDAVTIDLLRSLNSGNNIWANEWNNSGMQLMESS